MRINMKNCKELAFPLFSKSIAKPFAEYMDKAVVKMEKSVNGALKAHHNLYPDSLPEDDFLKRSMKNGLVHGLQSSLNPSTLIAFGSGVGEQGIPCSTDDLKQRFKEAPGLSLDQAIAMFALYANHNQLTRHDVEVLAGDDLNIEMAFDDKFQRAEFRSMSLTHVKGNSVPLGFNFKTDSLAFTSSSNKSIVTAIAIELGEALLVILTFGLSKLIEKLCEDDEELDAEKKEKLKNLKKILEKNLSAWEKEVKDLEEETEKLDEDIDKLDEEIDDLEDEVDDLEDDIEDEDDPNKKKKLREEKRKKRDEKRRKEKQKKSMEKEKKEKEAKLKEKKANLENAKDAIDEIDDILD